MFLERDKKLSRHKRAHQGNQHPNSVFHFNDKNFSSPPRSIEIAPGFFESSFLHRELGPCLTRAKWLGNLPLHFTDTGADFQWFSWRMLYAVATYLGSLGLIIPTVTRLCNPAHYTSFFDEVLFSEMYVGMFVPYLLTPVTCWLDSPRLALYLNSWVTFQKRYLEVTGKSLELNVRVPSTRLLRMNSFNSLIPACLWIVIPPYLTPMGAFTLYVYSLLHAFPIQAIWTFSCKGFEAAGRDIADCFQADLNNAEIPISARKVNQYKQLWVKLSELPNELSYTMYRTFTVKTLVMFWCMTLSLYGLLNCLQGKDMLRLAIFFSTFLYSTGPFFILCNGGHWVPFHIKERIETILKNYAPSEFHAVARDEMSAFLQTTVAQKCSLHLGGFVVFNRQLFLAAVTTAVTYLIVLLQFKLSLPKDEAKEINNTQSYSFS